MRCLRFGGVDDAHRPKRGRFVPIVAEEFGLQTAIRLNPS